MRVGRRPIACGKQLEDREAWSLQLFLSGLSKIHFRGSPPKKAHFADL